MGHSVTKYIGPKLADCYTMISATCAECRKLHEEAAIAIRTQLAALAEVAAAVQESPSTREEGLRRKLNDSRIAVMEAHQRFRNHVATHEEITHQLRAKGAICAEGG